MEDAKRIKSKSEFMNKFYDFHDELTGLASYADIINIEVETAVKYGEKIEDEHRRLRFYGRHYLELLENLQKAGILNKELIFRKSEEF